jgi:hypothetical protein
MKILPSSKERAQIVPYSLPLKARGDKALDYSLALEIIILITNFILQRRE